MPACRRNPQHVIVVQQALTSRTDAPLLMTVNGILEQAAHFIQDAAVEGDIAVDATVGNGHDTLTLARAVGASGRVYGFDVQSSAIEATHEQLHEAGLAARVSLIEAGHEQMDQHVPEPARGRVGAVMFNLGYLPGGDKSLTTAPETTLQGLDLSLKMLRPGGMITVVQYVGHAGGAEEAEAVDAWAAALDQSTWRVLSYRFVNQRNAPPRLLAIERKPPNQP